MKAKFYTYAKLIACITACITVLQTAAQVPVANFTANPISGCSPLVVNFQNQSTGNPTTLHWDFGNGNTSALQNPIATYFTPGTYTVSLTATNANGTNTLTRTAYITVYETPTVSFSANNTTGCFPLNVQFTDLSTPGIGNTNTSWLWDLGNGTISTQQNPFVSYTTAGNFTVTLRVTNDKGCTQAFTRPVYIRVTPGVDAAFTNSLPTVCAPPFTVSFTNGSTGPGTLSYQWDFGDGGTSTLQNPQHPYISSGQFTVTLITTSSAGCVDTARVPITLGDFNTNFTYQQTNCANAPITFTNTSAPVPNGTSWSFGDGGTATGMNASHTYTAAGTYTVWMYNTYAQCIDSISQTITVNPQPIADFNAPVVSKCEPPLTVNFQDLSGVDITAWNWDFGDGSTSTAQSPAHTYTNYGSFTVTLVVTSTAGCRDTIVRPDYVVIRRPTIDIPLFPERGCIPYTISPVAVINTLDAVTSYEWSFGDGGTSTAASPTHTYTVQGSYTVRLIITTSTGCRDTLTLPAAVRVGTKPVADFTAFPIPVCGQNDVYFTNLTIPSDEWLWSFGDGVTSTQQNPIHSYNDVGQFTVTLVAYNFGCPDTLIRPLYTNVLPPIARFNFATNCANRRQFTFTDISALPLTWEWNFGDGSPSVITQHPVHTFPALGSYNVRLIVTNGACRDTLIQQVRVVDENPDFISLRVACKIASIGFNTFVTNPTNIVNYAWDFGNGTANTASPTISNTYSQTGNFSVLLVTTDINGCRDSVTKLNYIRINGPTADFSAANTNGCTGLITTFTNLATTDGLNPIVSWRFDFGDGSSQTFTGPPFQHTYNQVGVFSVKLAVTDAAGCMDSIQYLDLVVTTDPAPDFVSVDTLSCPGGSVRFTNLSLPNNVTSIWDFGDGGTSTQTHPVHNYAAVGLYTVRLRVTDTNGCTDSVRFNNYIRVDRPFAGFAMSDSISSCLPFEVQFTNTSTFHIASLWDFGPTEGTSNLTNPTHYFSQPGTFQVKLIVTSFGLCRDSIIRTVQTFDTAGSVIDYIPVRGCSPLTLTYASHTNGIIANYFWDFGDGNTLSTTSPNVTHVYTTYGSYLPKLIMEDPSGCKIPVQGADTVYVTGANANFGWDTTLLCDEGVITFSDSTTFNDPVVGYMWDFGDGTTSTAQNPVHHYSSPGLYTVQLIVNTQIGCRDTLTKLALIRVVRSPDVLIAGDSVICVGESIVHSGVFLVTDTLDVAWQWTFPNGNTHTLQDPPPQFYIIPGMHTVTTIATNSLGCRDTTRQNIYVNPLPVADLPAQLTVQAGFPVTITGTYSPNTLSWLWSPATNLSCSNCPNPVATPHFNTIYQVHFVDSNGCSNDAAIELLVICKNANLFMPNTFTPNGDGSNDIFYPRGKGLERVRMLRIFNRWGEVVFEKREFPVNQSNYGWDGKFKGAKAIPDVYVYQLEVYCENGDIIRLEGNVALIL